MKQIELYVPIRDNAGQQVSVARWRQLRQCLLGFFGGFSTYRTRGRWADRESGRTYTDTCIVLRILCDGTRVQLDVIAHLAKYIKTYWQQQAVLYTVAEIAATYI